MRRMTHLTSPTLTRGSPSSPPALAGGEDLFRRGFLLGGAGLALTGCILACIPCCSPGCVLGIPFGIWGLIVLNQEDVKRAFQ